MPQVRKIDALIFAAAICTSAPAQANDRGALIEQALAARAQGDFPKAILLLEQARQSAPDDTEILRLLGTSYAFNQQFARAISLLERGHDLAPQDNDVSIALARTYLWAGKLDESKSLVDTILVANPANSEAAKILGQIAESHGTDRRRSGFYASQSIAGISLAYGHRTWWESTLGGYFGVGERSTLTSDLVRADRGFARDVTISARFDHKLAHGGSGYLALTATPGANFREEWSVRAGGQWDVLPAVSLTLDGRHAHYATVDVDAVEPGLVVRNGAVSAMVKMTNLWSSDGFYGNGWSTRLDAALPKGVSLYGGGATYPDTEAGITRRVHSLFVGGAARLDDRLRIRLGAEYERRKSTYTRRGVTVGLDWRF